MKTLILTVALAVSTALTYSQETKETTTEAPQVKKAEIEVAVLQNSQDIVNLYLAKEPGQVVTIKVFEDDKLLYKRRIKKAATANIKYDISNFPNGEYVFQVVDKKDVVYSAKVKRGSTELADSK